MNIFDRVAASLGYTKTQPIAQPPAWLVAEGDNQQFNIPDRQLPEAQLELYQRLSWVQIAVHQVAQAAAVAAFGVLALQGEKRRKVDNHPFELLLQRPNPLQDSFEFVYATIANYALTGNCYWWLNRASDTATPDEVWVIPPHKIKPVPDGRMFLRGYVFEPDFGQQVSLELHEVVHFKRYHPLNPFVGLSPIESLAITATSDMNMQRYSANYFDKGYAKPQGALAFADPIQNDQWETLKRDTEAQHGGTKRKLMMLRGVGTGGVQWIQMAMSQKDMEFLESRTFNKEEIFAMFAPGLSSMLAVNATEANSIAGKKTFTELGVWPYLVAIAKKITNDVLPVYGQNLVGEFDDIRITDRAMELQEQNAFSAVHTVDEVRERFYESAPIGDDRGKLLVAEVGKGLTNTNEPPAPPTAEQQLALAEASRPQPQAQPDKPQTEGQPESDEPDEELTKAARKSASIKAHTSAMVAFFMPPSIVAQIVDVQRFLPIASSPVPANELHMTFLLLGDIAQLAEVQPTIEAALGRLSQKVSPLVGRFNGIGRFSNVEPGGVDALYLSFDCKELQEWRLNLVNELRTLGIESPSEHGYIPHITLGYVPSESVTPMLYLPNQNDFELDTLALAWGDMRQTWRLMGDTPDDVLRDEETKRFRKWLKKRPNADPTKFDSDILSDAELVAIAAQLKTQEVGHDQHFFTTVGKAIRKLPGDDGNDEKRSELEKYHADKLETALRKIMRKVIPAGTTPENITPDSAWERYRENEKILRDAIVEMLMDGAQLGADTGIAQVEAVLGVGKAVSITGVNWDLVNEAVLEWVLGSDGGGFGSGYGNGLTTSIAQTAERQIRSNVAEWIRNDLPYNVLLDNLERTVFSRQRADMVATTEITRAYATGNRLAWQRSNVIRQMRWVTAADERVCPICTPRNGQIVSVDGNFDGLQPPAHPRCRCFITPIVPESL